MLLLALACAILAVLAFRAKLPADRPNTSALYRIDNRAIGSVLLILAAAFAVLAYTSGKLLF